MKLIPVVVLIEEGDEPLYRQILEPVATRFATDAPTATRTTMLLNGWTPEMIAWSTLLHAIADLIRDGHIEPQLVNHKPEPTDEPPTTDTPD